MQAAADYEALVQQPAHTHAGTGAVCDRCLQEIDEATFQANLQRLRSEVSAQQSLVDQAEQAVQAARVRLCQLLMPRLACACACLRTDTGAGCPCCSDSKKKSSYLIDTASPGSMCCRPA